MNEINIGDIVQAKYNSGEYVGEVIEERGNFTLVQVIAELKHYTQGDLHNPGAVDGVAVHERKALAHREKMNACKRTTHLYDGEDPTYTTSSKTAVEQLKSMLRTEDSPYNLKALEKIASLEEDFYHKIYD